MKFTAKFSKIEQAILISVNEILSPAASQLFIEQIALINKISRLTDDKEVNLYIKKGWFSVSTVPEQLKFPCNKVEYKLARIRLVNKDTKAKAKADVWAVLGQVFSINFSQAPKKLGEHFEIERVELLQDPMAVEANSEVAIDAKLPDDYEQLLAADTHAINGWHIFPQSEIREVADEGPNFLVLAEKEGIGVLALRSEEKTGNLYFCDFRSGEAKKVGNSLRQCCESINDD